MTTNFHERLSNDLTGLLENGYDHNVIIKVGEHQNVQSFQAHSAILYQRSPFFRRKLTDIPMNSRDVKEIRLDNISVESFAIIIKMKDNFKEDKSCACMHHKGYERPIRSSKAQFSVEEYEVFKVFNKLGLKIPNAQ
ncbi:12267_t:CDS:2 [Acaulospora morrowiae]|uniref:12267_t:CDS:1 n=1 Tax=Acaulospora morrowiae TaxID=94023 RepID=A0A9N9C9N3_9GLOM|nr:12267_t:CDS:2 [Acaulospora morrowiae]